MIIGSLRCLSGCEQDVYGWVRREKDAAERAFRNDEQVTAQRFLSLLTVVTEYTGSQTSDYSIKKMKSA